MNRVINFCFIIVILYSGVASASELEKNINLNLDRKAQIDLELSKTAGNVKELENLIRLKRKVLLQRARALNYLKNFKWGRLLAAENALVFERNLKILNKLNAYDFSLFKEYKSALRNLAQGRADLVTYAAELEQTISDLKLQEIKLAEEDLQRKKLLVAENKSSLLIYKGQLSYPTEGQVKLTYGAYRDEQNEYAFLVRGLLFETKKGAKIYAAGPGHVIFRDPIPYWGETIIIQHDDNYYSVYAGVSNMISNLNSFVQANEVVATASKTEFYFELRHFDNTLNPKNWLKDNNEQNIEKNHEQK